ncbi:MAG TPA: hypothetical protein VEB00_05070 [Clostridia bacterium]|nr:hypothetical protein [Clostridia bacterium]
MGFVKMPEMLSPELIKALAGNVYTAKGEPSPKDEMAATWKKYIKEDKKHDKKEDKKEDKKRGKKYTQEECWEDDECCCSKKVKFIFLLNNAVVININAVCEEESYTA